MNYEIMFGSNKSIKKSDLIALNPIFCVRLFFFFKFLQVFEVFCGLIMFMGIRTLILIIIVDYSDRPIQSLIGGKPDNLTE